MPILLRNLDDRRWQDLVDDGRALIPLYGPEWTDHNAHDPGITLVELLAWLAKMDIYQLNRITDRAKLKFLALVGFAPQPPHPAAAVLRLNLQGVTTSVDLPAGVEFSGSDPFGVATRFRILHAVSVLPASLAGVQAKGSAGFRDLTDRWRRGLPFGTFGDVPEPGAELYLGFDQAIPAGQQLSLYFSLTSPHARAEERQRLIAELAAQHQACLPPVITCAENTPPSASISARNARSSVLTATWCAPWPRPCRPPRPGNELTRMRGCARTSTAP